MMDRKGTTHNSASARLVKCQYRNAGKAKVKPSVFQPDLFNLDIAPVPPFLGDSKNPRVVRALSALMAGAVDRADLAEIAGARNSPALVSDLRDAGLEVPCLMKTVKDRDGRITKYGSYYLTTLDKMLVEQWAKRNSVKV